MTDAAHKAKKEVKNCTVEFKMRSRSLEWFPLKDSWSEDF